MTNIHENATETREISGKNVESAQSGLSGLENNPRKCEGFQSHIFASSLFYLPWYGCKLPMLRTPYPQILHLYAPSAENDMSKEHSKYQKRIILQNTRKPR